MLLFPEPSPLYSEMNYWLCYCLNHSSHIFISYFQNFRSCIALRSLIHLNKLLFKHFWGNFMYEYCICFIPMQFLPTPPMSPTFSHVQGLLYNYCCMHTHTHTYTYAYTGTERMREKQTDIHTETKRDREIAIKPIQCCSYVLVFRDLLFWGRQVGIKGIYLVPYSIMLVSPCVLYCAINLLILSWLYNTHYCDSTNKFNENEIRKTILVTIAPDRQSKIFRINLVENGIDLLSKTYEILKKKD